MLRNAGWLLSGKGVGALLSLIYLGMATRTLGPERFGEFMLILGLGQTIAAFATFQSWQVVIQYGMAHLRSRNTARLDRLTLFASALDLGSAILGGMAAVIGVMVLGPYMGWSQELSRHSLIFCLVLLFSLRSAPTGLLRLHDRYAAGTLAETMTPFVRLLGALTVVAFGASVSGFLAAWAVAELVTGAAFWLLAIVYAGFPANIRRWPSLAGVREENPGLWRYALTTNVIATLAVSSKQLSVVIVGLFVGPTAAGGYRLCYQLAQAVAKGSQMVSRALFPELVRAHSGDGRPAFAAMFTRSFLISAMAGIVLLVVVWTLSGPLIELIAGRPYRNQAGVLQLIGTAAAFDLAGTAFEPVLFSLRRESLAFTIRGVATFLLLSSMMLLMPHQGLVGAGIACLIYSSFAFVALGWACRSALRDGSIAQRA